MSGFKDRRPTISRSPNRRVEGPLVPRSSTPLRAERVGVEPTSPFGSPVFETGAIAGWLALPFQAGVAGFEPAACRLTAACSPVELHPTTCGIRKAEFGMKQCRFQIRIPSFAFRIRNSAHRESNPDLRHGKPAGSRYTMSAA